MQCNLSKCVHVDNWWNDVGTALDFKVNDTRILRIETRIRIE